METMIKYTELPNLSPEKIRLIHLINHLEGAHRWDNFEKEKEYPGWRFLYHNIYGDDPHRAFAGKFLNSYSKYKHRTLLEFLECLI